MLTRIQSSLRKGIERGGQHVGPFLVRFDEHSDNPFRNYAIPDGGAQPSAGEVEALVAVFAEHGRRPRLEYVAPAPGVDDALAAAGFTVELRLPLMTLTVDELRPPPTPPGVELVGAKADADLWDVARVQHSAYAEPGEVTRHDVERLRGTPASGGAIVLARCDGVPAGAGMYTAPQDGLAEVVAVGVVEAFRQRGIASALVAALSRSIFACGATPYLQTESHNERRLYGHLGYRTIGELLAVGLAAPRS